MDAAVRKSSLYNTRHSPHGGPKRIRLSHQPSGAGGSAPKPRPQTPHGPGSRRTASHICRNACNMPIVARFRACALRRCGIRSHLRADQEGSVLDRIAHQRIGDMLLARSSPCVAVDSTLVSKNRVTDPCAGRRSSACPVISPPRFSGAWRYRPAASTRWRAPARGFLLFDVAGQIFAAPAR